MATLNYTPNKNYPLTISKPSNSHKSFFIYEQDECDPIISKKFKTIDDAYTWASNNFPGYDIIAE